MSTKTFQGPTDSSDVRPITLTIPAFALGSIEGQLRQWADQLSRQQHGQRAEEAWSNVADIFEQGIRHANVTKPIAYHP